MRNNETKTAPVGGSAVSAQVRFRRPEKGMPDWSVWQQTSIKPNMPAWSIDSAGYEVEYRLLYTAPQPSAGVVMPTLVVKESGEWGDAYERGFKAALREFARLNGKEESCKR